VKKIYLYKFYNQDKEVIYIGKTENDVNLRIRTHYTNYKNK